MGSYKFELRKIGMHAYAYAVNNVLLKIYLENATCWISFIKCLLVTAGIDTIGGARVPAGYCGVIGFRSSHGTISNVGVLPVSTSLDTVGMCVLVLIIATYVYTYI